MDKFVCVLSNNKEAVVETENPSHVIAESFTANTATEENMQSQKKLKKVYVPKVENLTKCYNWVDPANSVPFCKLCRTTVKGGNFHLRRHENSSSHIKNVNAAAKCVKISQTLFSPQRQKEVELSKEAELKLCAFICDKNLPFLLMDTLPAFIKTVCVDSKIIQNVSIKRKKATKLINNVMAPVFREEICKDLQTTQFSLIIDETTDISTKKSMTVIVRYWKDGRVQDRFLNLLTVKSSTGESIFEAIMNFLKNSNISVDRIIGFGADNASTMMGHINGVKAKFREILPHIYVQGCSCHSLHLCASAAAHKLPGTVEQFTRDIYSYFSQSNKRSEELKECQIFANEKPSKMLYPSQTRWLSLQAVVNRILDHWNSLNLFFQRAALEDNLPSAKSILNALNNNVFKLYLFFLSYVLDLIIKVNIELQSETPKLPVLLNRITTLYKTVLKCFIKRNVLISQDFANIIVNNPANYLELEKIYIGVKAELFLKSTNFLEIDEHNFRLRVLEFFVELSSQIKKRFKFNDKYLQFSAHFTPEVALSGEIQSIADFALLFPNIEINLESANTEWQLLSEIELNCNKQSDINIFWKRVSELKNSLGNPMFPNLMIIVKIILSLPHSSAAAERSFSQLALIKTSLRNNLLISTCASILTVKDKLNTIGGSLEWKPDKKMLRYKESVNLTDDGDDIDI